MVYVLLNKLALELILEKILLNKIKSTLVMQAPN